jgi:hypothetical protein
VGSEFKAQATRKGTISTRTYAQEREAVLEDLKLAKVPEAAQKQLMHAADEYFRGIFGDFK